MRLSKDKVFMNTFFMSLRVVSCLLSLVLRVQSHKGNCYDDDDRMEKGKKKEGEVIANLLVTKSSLSLLVSGN